MICDEAKSLIKRFEGLRLRPYKCEAGRWTIGYGHTHHVKPGTIITKEEAERLLDNDLTQFEQDVDELVSVPLTENQRGALVSFVFNVGSDIDEDNIAEGLGDSTLLKKLNAGDYQGAADELLRWNKVNGHESNGLTKRRKAERELFLA